MRDKIQSGLKDKLGPVLTIGTIGAVYLTTYAINEVVNSALKVSYKTRGIPYRILPADDLHMFPLVVRDN